MKLFHFWLELSSNPEEPLQLSLALLMQMQGGHHLYCKDLVCVSVTKGLALSHPVVFCNLKRHNY